VKLLDLNNKEDLQKYTDVSNKVLKVLENEKMTPYEALIVLATLSASLQVYAYNNPEAFAQCTLKQVMNGIDD
jgi:hypothetical protein